MLSRVQSQEESFAVQECAFECAWCNALNDTMTAEWCSCLSLRPSMTCGACGRCFCDASSKWKHAFFGSSAATAFRQRAERLAQSFVSTTLTRVEQLRRPVILVVDDDKVVHVIAKRVLSEIAGTLVHASDGEAAFRLAHAVRPDLVITDALLPKLDGRELSRRLKTTPETQHAKVAVMTALYKGGRYRSEALRQFLVDDYVEKPLKADTLRALAKRLLPKVEEKEAV